MALLEKPFYSPTYPGFMNFGGTGFVVGHELSHAMYVNAGVMKVDTFLYS